MPGRDLTRALIYLANVWPSLGACLEAVTAHPERWFKLTVVNRDGRATVSLEPAPRHVVICSASSPVDSQTIDL